MNIAANFIQRAILVRALWLCANLFIVSLYAPAQSTRPDSQQPGWVHDDLREAQFPGGSKALLAYLRQRVQYPAAAARAGITGKVIVSFVIDTLGEASDFEVLKSLGYGCDEEALRIARGLPRWTPSSLSGRKIRVKYYLSIMFTSVSTAKF